MIGKKRTVLFGCVLTMIVLLVVSVQLIPKTAVFSFAENIPENASKINVEGADAKSEDAIKELEKSNGIVLFAEKEGSIAKSHAAQKDNVVLSYSRRVQYENFYTRNFRVKYDGKTRVAYCVQPKEMPPAEGRWTATEYNNKLMTKALYYSYGYPGYDKKTRPYLSKRDIDEDYEDDDGAYALSHMILSYFYDRKSADSDAFLGISSDTKKLIKNVASLIENKWPDVPDDSSLSLNIKNAKATWDKGSQKQKTPVFKLKGHEDNRIYVTVPSYATMIKNSDGVSKSYYRGKDNSSKVKVFGGDTFYFTATEKVKGTFKSPEMQGALADFQPYLISISGKQNIVFCGKGDTDSVAFTIEWANLGTINLKKSSKQPSITSNNSNYSLKGAKYGLYDNDGKLYDTLVTGDNGNVSVKVPYGKYYLKESSASKGYTVDPSKHYLTVKSSNTDVLVKESPMMDTPEIIVQKKDKELYENDPESKIDTQFGASLEGAQYTITYYDGYYDDKTDFSKLKHVRKWVIKTDASGKAALTDRNMVSGDELYCTSEGTCVLPLGTITIKETKAPKGYIDDSRLYVRQITGNGQNEIVDSFEPLIHKEQIIRGDIKFFKQADGNEQFLAGIPFKLTSKSTGESKIIVTDKNGMATTENSNIHFGIGTAERGDAGSLPFDTYILDEMRCENNIGMQLVKGIEVEINKNEKVVDLGIIIDKRIALHTTALTKEEKRKNIVAGSDTKIIDTVKYEGLERNKDYIIKGHLMDRITEKPLLINGKKVTGESRFTTDKESGETLVEFAFDSTGMEGKSIVVFEYLYEGDQLIAVHEDINSEAQTVKILEKNSSPVTGDRLPVIMIMAIAITALFGLICAIRITR